MKKNLITLSMLLGIIGVSLTSAYQMNEDPDGKAGATGSPGEVTCADADCHATYQLNAGPGSITISSSNLTNWEYVPGQSYTISVTVAQASHTLFGLGFEALKSNGDNAGTLVAGTGTQIKTKNVLGYSRKSITHNDNTGTGNGSHTFTFTWNAPSTDVGDVTFYVAGNACNNNGNENGDYVYSTSQVVTAAGVGVNESNRLNAEMSIFPNPAIDQLNITSRITQSGFVQFNLFDARGALVKQATGGAQGTDMVNHTIDVADLSSGQYMLQMLVGGNVVASRMVQKQ